MCDNQGLENHGLVLLDRLTTCALEVGSGQHAQGWDAAGAGWSNSTGGWRIGHTASRRSEESGGDGLFNWGALSTS